MLYNIANAKTAKGDTNWVLYLRRRYTKKDVLPELNSGVFDRKIMMKDIRYILWVINPAFNINSQRKEVVDSIRSLAHNDRELSENVSSVTMESSLGVALGGTANLDTGQHRLLIRLMSVIAPLAIAALLDLNAYMDYFRGRRVSFYEYPVVSNGFEYSCSKVQDFTRKYLGVYLKVTQSAYVSKSLDLDAAIRKLLYTPSSFTAKYYDEPIEFDKLRKLAMVMYSQAMRI
jgi:hypothetical protein